MNSELLTALAISLGMTLILEMVFFGLTGKRNRKDLLLLVFVNIITNPSVVLIYQLAMLYTSINNVAIKIALELFAVLTEGYYYKKHGHDFKRPYLFSLAANMMSFGIGVLIQIIIWEVRL